MSKAKYKLVIFGNAEIASLAKYYFTNDSSYEVVGFTVDDDYCESETYEGLPLVPWSKVEGVFPTDSHHMHVALSYQKLNKLREEKYNQAKYHGYKLANYISSSAVVWPDLETGDNCFVLENQIIQPSVKIGNNVMIWSGNHIGHGTTISDHVYISSQVCISGHCKIGERTFLGVNCTIRDFCSIESDCFITMSASVTASKVNSGSVIIASESKVFEEDNRVAKSIKRKYFGI